MTDDLTSARIRAAYERARDELLAERNERGHWTGELSTSALSTATAVMALEMVRRASPSPLAPLPPGERGESSMIDLSQLINGGLVWLAAHQNEDGGWGDTTKSFSNISTTMLCRAAFHVKRSDDYATFHVKRSDGDSSAPSGSVNRENGVSTDTCTADTAVAHDFDAVLERAEAYIDQAGGVPAVVARYGKDKTFSVPILTHCALAGLVDWSEVQQLPFELACLPPQFYKTVRLPVVSYALPALIAIGQVRHHFRPTRVPGLRQLRNASRRRSLNVLERIQPSNGGFLEATPLTSFVTMSLAGMGLVEHPVVQKGVEFIVNSVRDDGSWPIDTNLATWVTTLSVNALGPDLPEEAREPILRWLLDQQFKKVHPFTNADPGGWSWTDLPGGVPDADDTPGAILAILELVRGQRATSREATPSVPPESTAKPQAVDVREPGDQRSILPDELVTEAHEAVRRGVRWLLDLQNRDSGWPTFCRGWGKLPFDRSSPDITAHCLRALMTTFNGPGIDQLKNLKFLVREQDENGSWFPLWFGNQHVVDERNPTYGTARVMSSLLTLMRFRPRIMADKRAIWITGPLAAGFKWLLKIQNPDGGWGGDVGCPSSVEETALAVEVLLSDPAESSQLAARRGLCWLIERIENGTYREPTPIGFYFAKLWYFERLYPLIFTAAALRRACEVLAKHEST